MSRKVTLGPGHREVALPGGVTLSEGEEVVVSDEAFASLSRMVASGLILDLGATEEVLTPPEPEGAPGGPVIPIAHYEPEVLPQFSAQPAPEPDTRPTVSPEAMEHLLTPEDFAAYEAAAVPNSTFVLRFNLSRYAQGAPAAGVKIFAEPLTMPYPSAGDGTTYVDIPSVVTDAAGYAEMTLVSLPGLQYRIESWATGTRVISGDWTHGTVLDFEDTVSVVPSPIPAKDANALRAEIIALIEAGAVAGPPGPEGPAGPPGPPGPDVDEDLPDFRLIFENHLV